MKKNFSGIVSSFKKFSCGHKHFGTTVITVCNKRNCRHFRLGKISLYFVQQANLLQSKHVPLASLLGNVAFVVDRNEIPMFIFIYQLGTHLAKLGLSIDWIN